MRSRQLEVQDILRNKAGIDTPEKGQAAQHKTSAGKKNESQCHFGDDKSILRVMVNSLDAATGFFQRIVKIGPSSAPSGYETKKNSYEHRESNSKEEYGCVQPNLLRARQCVRKRGKADMDAPLSQK